MKLKILSDLSSQSSKIVIFVCNRTEWVCIIDNVRKHCFLLIVSIARDWYILKILMRIYGWLGQKIPVSSGSFMIWITHHILANAHETRNVLKVLNHKDELE